MAFDIEKLLITKDNINLSNTECDALYNLGKDLILQDRDTVINYAITAILHKHYALLQIDKQKGVKNEHKGKVTG